MSKNNIKIYDDYAEIILDSPTHGKCISLIDLGDVDRIKETKWSVNRYGNQYDVYYLVNRKEGLLHRFIMNAPKDEHVDHIDGNTLNNRKENLRLCKHEENLRNTKMYSTNSSGHKGVCWNKKTNCWMAYIWYDSKHITLGYFTDIDEAARVRKEAEKKYFGEFRSSRS